MMNQSFTQNRSYTTIDGYKSKTLGAREKSGHTICKVVTMKGRERKRARKGKEREGGKESWREITINPENGASEKHRKVETILFVHNHNNEI